MAAFGETIVRRGCGCDRRFRCPFLILAVTALLAHPALAQPSPLFYRTDYALDAGDRARAGLVIADLNNDGRLDLAVGAGNGMIDVALGNGDGSFQRFTSFLPTGAGVSSAAVLSSAVADFDGDGNMDLVLYLGNGVVLLPGKGDGSFGPGRQILSQNSFSPPDPSTQLLEVADLNHDGRPDLVFLSYSGVSPILAIATVLLNNGNGTFSSRTAFNLPSNEYAVGVAIADFNHDGAPDLAVITQLLIGGPPAGHVYVGLGKGDGSFSSPVAAYALSRTPFFIAAADLNHDGAPDLVIDSNGTLILLNNGDGSFHSVPNNINLCCSNPGSIAVADWTKSGNPGLGIFTQAQPEGVGILGGNGDGTFYSAGTAQLDPHAAAPYQFSSADLNGDGLPDLVALVGGNISVLLNAGTGPPSFFVPSSAASGITSVAPGSIATIYANFPFSATQSSGPPPAPLQLAGVIVSVRDSVGVTRAAPLFYVSPTQVNLEIPAGTAPGVATVAVGSGGPPVFGAALVRNVVPAIFTEQASSFQGGTYPAAYAIAYGTDNQPQPPLRVTACQSVPRNDCAPVPIPRQAGSRVFLELFATGIRNHVSPVVVALAGGPAVNQTVAPAYAGAQGQFDGFDQVNVEITNLPTLPGAPSGTIYNLVLNVDGFVSNAVVFAVQ
jgi:uncharacterized protein (TIGR03437 family)